MDVDNIADAVVETPFPDILELTTFNPKIEELREIIDENSDKWELFAAEDKERVKNACNVLKECDRRSSEAIAEVMCTIAKYSDDDAEKKNECIEFVLQNCRSDIIAQSMLAKMATISPSALISHIGTFCAIVEDITESIGRRPPPPMFAPGDEEFILVMIDLFPVFVRLCLDDHKCAVFDMLSDSCLINLIGDKQCAAIWEGLKIGINETNLVAQNAAYRIFVHFCCNYEIIRKEDYKEEIFTNLLKVMENYCRYHCVDHEIDDEQLIFNTLDSYCKAFGDDFVQFLPMTMESLLNAMNPSDISMAYLNDMIISSLRTVFEIADAHMLPYLPRLSGKLKEYLANIFAEYNKDTAISLASAIGNGKFRIFFIPLAFEVFDESSNEEVRSGLLSLFGAMNEQSKLRSRIAPYLPKLVTEMVALVQRNEFNATEKSHLKIQAIKSLKSLATKPGAAFAPHTDLCYDAVYGQLDHPEMAIRIASVEALAQFVTSFFQINSTERSHQITAQSLTTFANTLKTDSSLDVAIAVFEAYRILLTKSPVVFDDKMELFNEVFNCVNDVMCAKTICQAGADFFDNMPLVQAAKRVFLALGRAMKSYEFAIYFNSIMPVLSERFECAKQTKTKETQSFRSHVYHILLDSIRLVKAYARTSFDEVLPMLLFGLQDEHASGRRTAIDGLAELLLHAGESANTKSIQISEAFEKVLANVGTDGTTEAIRAVARLILAHNQAIFVELFVPKIVEYLKRDNWYWTWDFTDVFRCFHMLLNENNGVLLSLLYHIILIGFKMLTENQYSYNLLKSTRDITIGFLKDCRKRFGFLVDLALIEVPGAVKIAQNL